MSSKTKMNILGSNQKYVYEVIDGMMSSATAEDWTLKETFSVKAYYDDPAGKWPAAVKDSTFMDNTYFFQKYSKQIATNIATVYLR